MSTHDLEFGPSPLNASEIAANTRADLEAFNDYIERELLGVQLFGTIASRLVEQRPDETHVETDVVAGRVGLEVADIVGALPARLSNSDTPLVQDIYYAPVSLPDDNYALLRESVHRRGGIDSEIIARIPWLHILSSKALSDVTDGKVDYLSDVAFESYSRHNLDRTGRTENETPFSDAHRLFFSHPLGEGSASELDRQKRELLQEQAAYIARLQAVARVVLDNAQE